MQTKLFKIFFWMAIAIVHLNAHESCIEINTSAITSKENEKSQIKEIVFQVELQDLYVEQDSILVNVDGISYAVLHRFKSY
jgi:hypothetical protein